MSKNNDSVLVCENIGMQFGGLAAVRNFDISIPNRALYGLIGPNGAGKTTVFNIISGVLSPTAGRVKLFGEDITGLTPDEIAKRGVARTLPEYQAVSRPYSP